MWSDHARSIGQSFTRLRVHVWRISGTALTTAQARAVPTREDVNGRPSWRNSATCEPLTLVSSATDDADADHFSYRVKRCISDMARGNTVRHRVITGGTGGRRSTLIKHLIELAFERGLTPTGSGIEDGMGWHD